MTLIKTSTRGFSLIEIMVVVTLMAILISIGTVVVMDRLEEGKKKTAQTQVYELAKAMDLYKLQTGSYPSVSDGLEALANPTRGRPIMESIPQDPWGNPYNYVIPGVQNTNKFDIWSNGPSDSPEDESSRIGNWQTAE